MFSHDWSNRKRGRDIEDDYAASGFSEHRQKRHIASLPHRASPNSRRHISPSLVPGFTSQPAPPTITPADSDNEEAAAEVQDRSAFSPWSSSPSPAYKMTDTQSTPMSDTAMYSDDMDMMDSVHLSPGPFTTDPSPSIAGRIPTPIHSSFSPFVRSEKAPRNDPEYINEESMVDRIRRGRRLPSPISEGETSPSVVLEGLGDMQMEVEPNERETPTKKGHSRSKHSLRNWTGFPGEVNSSGLPVKRTFSMGYRSDCDKCRMKVPGHFSHIITYD